MQKRKNYKGVKFSARAIRAAMDKCNELVGKKATDPSFTVTVGDESWGFDDLDEFLTSYGNEDVHTADFGIWWPDNELMFGIFMDCTYTAVRVRHASRASIETVFSIFEETGPADKVLSLWAKRTQLFSLVTGETSSGRSSSCTFKTNIIFTLCRTRLALVPVTPCATSSIVCLKILRWRYSF